MKVGDLVRAKGLSYCDEVVAALALSVNDCYGIVSHVSLNTDRSWAFVSFMQKDGSITNHKVYSEYLNVISEIIS
tara:strand:+ start:438 stop:662 length:225 start_codon:yes stop_codon:yes gene_type:complete